MNIEEVHLSPPALARDVWFYRLECRYLRDAWLAHPSNYEPDTLMDNEKGDLWLRAVGRFSIPESFYVESRHLDPELPGVRHLNAVDLNICFNQLAYVLINEGIDHGLLPPEPLGLSGVDPREERINGNMMIAKIGTTFVRPIDPREFDGWLAITRIYHHKGLPFVDMSFEFSDSKGGFAVGTCRGVIFVQNFAR